MARLNKRLIVPVNWATAWAGAVGADVVTLDAYDECARVILVGTLNAGGTLVLRDIAGTDVAFTFNDMSNQNNYIRGQWQRIVAAGSANAFNLKYAW